MTYILHLETATKVCSVALSADGSLVQLAEIADDQYAHGEQLTLLIDQVFKAASLKPADLSAVAVTSGPGSYTGLRIGVSTAKGLCYALKIPLIAIDALVSMAALAVQKHPNSQVCPMIDARRMEVFAAIYASDLTIVKPISADVLDENSYEQFGSLVCFGDGAEKMKDLWENRPIQFDLDLHPSASGQVTLAYQKYQAQQFEDVAYFEPFYLKEFYMPTKTKA
jgi:tRNA threonylcarbamoyladenosine biosynthesis protein TsaB